MNNHKHLNYYRCIRVILPFMLLTLFCFSALAQTTSWRGTSSTSWSNAANWTNGVPNSTTDAIIGDGNFTGSSQPSIASTATTRSLTIGGTVYAKLTVGSSTTIYGNLLINSNGVVGHNSTSLSIKGDFTNNGSYLASGNKNAFYFSGAVQTIRGSSTTTFRKLYVNAGATVNLATSIATSIWLYVYGTFNPGELPINQVTGNRTIQVFSGGKLKVTAATVAGNYNTSSITVSTNSTVEYCATTTNQTISNYSYTHLIISGTGTKSLAASLSALVSTNSGYGNIYVYSGILDLGIYTANRGTSTIGGNLLVANGATLRIAGTNTFPANYASTSLEVNSTVQYSGAAQTVAAKTYGHLYLSSSSGTVAKTMPAAALTIAGDFTLAKGVGTGITCTAAGAMNIGGSIDIGASTTFNAAALQHNIGNYFTNNGTFTASTSTITLSGTDAIIAGTSVSTFNNIVISGTNVTTAVTSIIVAGNLSTTGVGTFSQTAGTLTMSGAAKTIIGTNISLNNLIVSGTASTTGELAIAGNLTVNTSASFTSTAGTITMSGALKTIANSGTLNLYNLTVSGSVSTATNLNISSLLAVEGSLTATAGTATFTGASMLEGTASLFNVVLNGTSLQLATDSELGIAGTYTITAGALNTTSTTPNTVHFKSTTAQNIASGTFHNLTFSNSNKTAIGIITINGNFTNNLGATFTASTFTHLVKGNWTNNGTFTAGTSGTIQFTGAANATISGVTTFNILTLNKSAASNTLTLFNNVSAATVNMTQGSMNTQTSTLTITNTRTGTGIIIGNILRSHTFATGVVYEFEGPYNTITFASLSGVTSVLVKVSKGTIADFPAGGSTNRLYDISIPAGTYNATLRLHYEDAELNGNTENSMQLWKYSTQWMLAGKTASNATNNYVELAGITAINTRWSMSDDNNVVRWNGSTSGDWATAANWTSVQGSPAMPPSAIDIVEIGTATFTNQPVISTPANAKAITLGSVKAVNLSLTTGGTLTTQGNINGTWTANATHNISVNNQTLVVNGDLLLSDGVAGHEINLAIAAGTTNIVGTLTQSGAASVIFSNAGSLNLANNYTYTAGTFTSSTGTVTYTGAGAQTIAPVSYHNLQVNKTTGIASIAVATTIKGTLTLAAGQLDVSASTTIAGDLSILSGATLTANNSILSVGGNFANAGTFIPSGSTLTLNGTGAQTISATPLNNLTINKTAGIATLTGNLAISGNLTVTAGTTDLSTYSASRTVAGGVFTLSGGATLLVGGAANFPINYSTNTISAASTVHYNGTVAQAVTGLTYGNLTLSNGATNAKTLSANSTINGNLIINSGASLNAGSTTISLAGNWTNSGTFTPGTSTVNFNGTTKTITGNTAFNKMTVNGKYTIAGSNYSTNSALFIATGASLVSGSGTGTIGSDLINNGTLTSTGTLTYTGSVVQNIQMANNVPSSLNIVNFNGTVAPLLATGFSPTFNVVNINNTAGITTTIGWTVQSAMTIGSGASFNGSSYTHNFYGAFTNNGTVSSSGVLNFAPTTAQTILLKGTSFISTGNVIFGGTGAINVAGTPNTLTAVTVLNTAGVTPASNWTISENFTVDNDGVFNAGGYTYNVAGNFISSGTFNGGTSVVTLSGTAVSLGGSDFTTLYDLVLTGSVSATSDFRVGRNFTNNGSFDGTGGALILTGSVASTIGGTATTYNMDQLSIQKTPGTTATLARNLTMVSALDISAGILDASTYTITQETSGGMLSINENATLKIRGNNPLPVFNTYELDSLSTVEFAGVTQSITSLSSKGARYGNLVISATGTKTANGPLNIRNNFTLSNGTFVAGSYIDTLGGNWTMTSGTFTNTGSTIMFDGAGVQEVASTGVFNNIRINKTGGSVLLGSNITVNGILTFTSKNIVTGTYTIILPASATVSGAGQSTGWVQGRMQRNVTTGISVSRTYEIGSNNYYTPVTAVFASATIAGNFVAGISTNDHPGLAGADLDGSKSINKYWTFANAGTIFVSAAITVNWNAAEIDADVVTNSLVSAYYNGISWIRINTANASATSIQLTPLIAFGDFVLAQVSNTAWTGTTSTNWLIGTNWSTGAVPTSTINVTIPSGAARYPIVSGGIATARNLTVQPGATLSITSTLQVDGVLTAATGSIFADNGTLEMKGTVAQTINAGIFSNELANLIVNNTAGVSLEGALKINNILSLKNGVLYTNDFLTLRSNSGGTARVGPVTSVAPTPIVGKVTVERYIAGRRKYRLITSPVTTSTSSVLAEGQEAQSIWGNWQNAGVATSGIGTIITGGTAAHGFDQATPSASLYTYNESTRRYVAFSSTNGKNTKYTPLKAGVGYYMFVYGDRINSITSSTPNPTTFRQTGTLLTGNQVYTTSSAIPLSNIPGNFSLIGNPYACTIDWKTVTKTNISKTTWGWDANLSSTGGYVTVTATTLGALISPLSVLTAVSRYIQPGQAFFVQTTAANPQVVITEGDKIDDNVGINSNVFRGEGVNVQPLMAINLTYRSGASAILSDGAVVAFDSSYKHEVTDEDGLKFEGSTESIGVQKDLKFLSIETRPLPEAGDTIALRVARLTKSQYTLQIFADKMQNLALQPLLYDAFLKSYTTLSLADTNYITFNVSTNNALSSAANRFVVVFRAPSTLPVTFTSVSATKKDKVVEVNWNVVAESGIQRYEVQRAADGVNFKTIATVAATGNNNSTVSYSSIDKDPAPGVNYYQVKSVQKDGLFVLTRVVQVKMDNREPTVKVFPNPVVDNRISVQLSDLDSGTYTIELFNIVGQKLVVRAILFNGGTANYELIPDHKLSKGVYQLRVSGAHALFNQNVVLQ